MRSDLNLELKGRVCFSEYDGSLKVSCGDLFLRFPAPDESDQTVRLGLDTPHPEVNFLMAVTLGDLPIRPRPETDAEVRDEIRRALGELGAELAKEEITRLGKLALQLLQEGEGGGAYFSPELARAAYLAAGETLPEYLRPKADPVSEANLKALKTWLR